MLRIPILGAILRAPAPWQARRRGPAAAPARAADRHEPMVRIAGEGP
jgi:hypothetical protein